MNLASNWAPALGALQNPLDLAARGRHSTPMTFTSSNSALHDRVAQRLEHALGDAAAPRYDEALRVIADAFSAVSATLHSADADGALLQMVAHLGLPPPIVALTQRIPFGKGIAGLCAERREPITLCNLQTDASGAARPEAKQTGVAGAIAVPVFAPNGALVGTLGVGKAQEHTYSEEEQRMLTDWARRLGRALSALSASPVQVK